MFARRYKAVPAMSRPVVSQASGGPGRRRQMPLVVVGVLLVVGCALGFADASLSLASHEDVLAVAQPSVVGRPVAVALVAGALLVPGEIGTGSPAASGADVVAVALKAGLFPPDLAPGNRVQVASSEADGVASLAAAGEASLVQLGAGS